MPRTQSSPARNRPPRFAANWALFLDVDGTLLEFARRPDAVRVDAGLRCLLTALQRASGGAIALISGRPVAEIEMLFAPLRLPAAGLHGLERRDADGRLHRHEFPRRRLRDATRRLAKLAAAHPGLLVEDKGAGVAVHYRQVPRLAGFALDAVQAELSRLGPAFELQRGKMVLEIKPGGRDKGIAIAEFMSEPPFAGRVPVFIGDDATDEYGFRAVDRLRGRSVKVRAGASAARWRLPNSAGVRSWLQEYVLSGAAD